ncbi:hypothetical protein [Leptolyngbya sp. AN10]|uniref:hypothetical protein n=1 Tax=Leptolyngbya sp. AN10 TaxID=3423365 RepID=UPI003D3135CE
MEITIPPSGVMIFIVLVLITGFPVLMFAFLLYWAYWEDKLQIVMFSLPFLYLFKGSIRGLLHAFFESTRLHIDQLQIYVVHETPWSSKYQPPSPTSAIYKVELTGRSTRIIERTDGREIDVTNPELIIWTDQQKYRISSDEVGVVSEADVKWLANEVGNWLNLPVT